jgi:hypothetical protein
MLLDQSAQYARENLTLECFQSSKDASYAGRYEILLTKLVRERLYDAACLLMSNAADGVEGIYREPSAEINSQNFVVSLLGKAIAAVEIKR